MWQVKTLVAYVQHPIGPPPASSEIQAYLQAVLPPYMVPGHYVSMGGDHTPWPLNPSRKVDRKR
jgi:hypothetical protein